MSVLIRAPNLQLHTLGFIPHCNTCNTLQHTATHCNTLRCSSSPIIHTRWRRCIGCLELQVSFHKRATNYRALLQKINNTDKAFYGSSPPCRFITLTQSWFIITALYYIFGILYCNIYYQYLSFFVCCCSFLICLRKYIFVYMYVYTYIYKYIYIYTHISIYIYLCIYIYLYIYMYIHI